jgi:hypothetical protein
MVLSLLSDNMNRPSIKKKQKSSDAGKEAYEVG